MGHRSLWQGRRELLLIHQLRIFVGLFTHPRNIGSIVKRFAESVGIPEYLQIVQALEEMDLLGPEVFEDPAAVPKAEQPFPSIAAAADRSRRPKYTGPQNEALVRFYGRNKFPTPDHFVQLAKATGLDRYQVKKWFQNRRSRDRKHQSKLLLLRTGGSFSPGRAHRHLHQPYQQQQVQQQQSTVKLK